MNIILTGASSGIGEAILKRLYKNSSNNLLVICRNKPNIQSTNINWIKADLSDKNVLSEIEEDIKKFKGDILINNAGSGKVCDLTELEINDIERELTLNLVAPMILTSIVCENMKKNNYGRIINISSISGLTGTPYLFTYSASKAGLLNFTQSSAEYFHSCDITVNSICPGGIDTNMAVEGRKKISSLHDMQLDEYQKNMLNLMGRKELISSEDVANTVEFLINNNSINGQTINVCGLIEK